MGSVGDSVRRIVVVCQVFYPDTSATSQLFTGLLPRMAGGDRRITVLCGFPTNSDTSRIPSVPKRETFQNLDVIRCGWRVDGKRGLGARALAYMSFLIEAGIRLLSIRKKELVFGVTNPPFVGILLWLLSDPGRFKYQYMLLDVYPEGLIRMGKVKDGSIAVRCWRRLNRLAYQRADRVIALGRDMVSLLTRQYALRQESISYVPHWSPVEPESIGRPEQNVLLDRLGLAGKFVIQYSGNMGLWHDVEGFVHAAYDLRDREEIHFLFIGDGIRRPAAERLSRRLGLTNITWLDFMPEDRLPESLGACHVALISLQAGLEGVAVPSKLYGILAAGRAVVAQVPADSEVAYVVQESGCGVQIEPGNIDQLTGVLRELAAAREYVDRMGARARLAYTSNYTLERAARTLAEIWDGDGPGMLPLPPAIRAERGRSRRRTVAGAR